MLGHNLNDTLKFNWIKIKKGNKICVLKVKDFAPREVLLVNYKFNQATDQEGQVAGIVRGGQITIRVKALNDGNPELLAWMLDPAAPHDLEVEFENTKEVLGRR